MAFAPVSSLQHGEPEGVVLIDSVTGLPLTSLGGGGGPLPAGTDRSGSIVTGGVANATPLAPANAARTALTGQNISTDDLWLTENGTTAVIGGVGSYQIKPNATFSVDTNRAVSVIGPTTGQKWTATEKP